VPRSLLKPTNQTLRAANGTEIAVLGQAALSLCTETFTSSVTGLVSDHVSEVMLGVDWLTVNNAMWDFRGTTVRLGGRDHNLRSLRSEQNWCRRVVLQEDVEVPPRAQMDVPTKVVFRGRPAAGKDLHWGTKSVSTAEGIHVARTLMPTDRYADVPVRVMNVQQQPCTVKAGTVISDLEPVSVLGPYFTEQEKGPMSDRDRTLLKDIEEELSEEETPEFIETLVNGVDKSVPEGAVHDLKELLVRNRKVFSESEYELGLTDMVVHHIDTDSARPVRQQLRRFPPAHVEAISSHVDNMLRQGVIEPASSPWASNVVLVKKKDGTYRCCIDYRQLNTVTRKDAYPLPRIDSCLDAMAEAKWFSTFDLRSSYHQVRVNPEDSDKTAFICPRGMYKFKTMPFGLCNAGATFQRLMDIVMTGLHLEICLVYLDDIVVYSSTVAQHLERLEMVFSRLDHAGLKLKPEKCAFFRKSVAFLGHVISDQGIETDPAKVAAVAEWPIPTSVGEVRAFVGLASYYRRFVKGFANIASPLHALMRKNTRFHWSEDAQWSFDRLKSLLTSPPILAMPNDSGEFVLDTDACDNAIGAVLSQRQDGVERVIAYASRSLDRRECNYCVTRKELLAVVHFLKYFKQYLLGRTFKVRTDHAALTWLRRTPDPIGQQGRWLEQMEEFNFTVEHRPGLRHGNADGLSRRPCAKTDCFCGDRTANAFGGPADRPPFTERFAAGVKTRQETEGSRRAIRPSGDFEVSGDPVSQSVERLAQQLREEEGIRDSFRFHVQRWDQYSFQRKCHELYKKHQWRGRHQPPANSCRGFPCPCVDEVSQEEREDYIQRQQARLEECEDTVAELRAALTAQHPANGAPSRTCGVTTQTHQPDGAVAPDQSDQRGPQDETVLPWSLEGLQSAQRQDPDIGFVIEVLERDSEAPQWDTVALKSRDVKVLWKQWPRLEMHGGLLKRRFESNDGKTERWQVVWPKESRTEFLSIAHSGMTGGHLGQKKTAAAVQSRAYWPTWSSDLTTFMKRCNVCARYHRGAVPHRAPMQTPLVGEPWERVSVDITGPHPRSSRQNQFILTIVDHFSKWGEAIPLANHTAPVVAKALMVHVFSRFGTPLQLLTDRGPEFESQLFAQLMKWLEVDKLRTTAYKPSTNGVVERFHRTLNSMLGKVVSDSQRDWDDRLPLVMAAYRAAPHSSTGFSPNRLFLGRENRMPLDLVMGLPPDESNRFTDVNDFVAHQQDLADAAGQVARDQLHAAAQRRKKDYDIRVKKKDHGVGDWVWYHYPRRYTGKSPKWSRCYVGPYLIIRLIEPSNYVLQKSERAKPFVVHADKLKRCYSPPSTGWITIREDETETRVPLETWVTTDADRPDASGPSARHPPPTRTGPIKIVSNPRSQRCSGDDDTPERLPRAGRNKVSPGYLRDYVC
jgi:transposase InsO family protein